MIPRLGVIVVVFGAITVGLMVAGIVAKYLGGVMQ
jgi:hypothetical protein